jgi:hypothetical protein
MRDDSLFERFAASQFFTIIIDLASKYHQILVAKEDEKEDLRKKPPLQRLATEKEMKNEHRLVIRVKTPVYPY